MSAPKGGNRLQKKSSGQKHWTLILFMVPGLVYLLINNYIPMAGILLAFKKVNYTLGIFKSPWCGLSNFKYLFKTKGCGDHLPQYRALQSGLHRSGYCRGCGHGHIAW